MYFKHQIKKNKIHVRINSTFTVIRACIFILLSVLEGTPRVPPTCTRRTQPLCLLPSRAKVTRDLNDHRAFGQVNAGVAHTADANDVDVGGGFELGQNRQPVFFGSIPVEHGHSKQHCVLPQRKDIVRKHQDFIVACRMHIDQMAAGGDFVRVHHKQPLLGSEFVRASFRRRGGGFGFRSRCQQRV